MRAVITFTTKGRMHRLLLPPVFAVGRDESCDLALDHGFVSGKHCTFFSDERGVSVVDQDSSNGTVVNGVVIRGRASLADGDVIEIGPYVLTLSCIADAEPLPAQHEGEFDHVEHTVPRAAARTLGAQMKTMPKPAGVARVTVEAVDGPRSRDGRTSFRDVVTLRDCVTLTVGDLAPCVDAGTILAQLRKTLRDLADAGATPGAIALGVASLPHRKKRQAQILIARVEPALHTVTWVGAHPGEPYVVGAGDDLARLAGARGPGMLGDAAEPTLTEHFAQLATGEVLILPSQALVPVLRMIWPLEPPHLGPERRAAACSMWLTNQAAKAGEEACALCAELT